MSGEVTADTPLAALRKKSGILADPRTSEKIGAISGGRKSAESEKRAGDPLLAKRDSILAMIDKRRSSILDEARNSVFADRKTSLIEGEQPRYIKITNSRLILGSDFVTNLTLE